jgi:dTDP-4-amino-4,6-dideoxygalactose transaminase
MAAPARRTIPLGTLEISETQRRYVNQVLDSNRLSYGDFSREFERRFAAAHDARHAILMNSGTSALQVALAALREAGGWADGDEVIVPAVTFIATSNIVLMNGLRPVFADVEARTYNLDPARLEERITPRTRAIIPVHLCGLPCDMDPILDIARRHGLKVLEDSCETMFARYRGRPVGTLGDVAAFSTYVAHLIVTGVGGLVVTNDDDLAIACRSLMAHGRDSIYLSIDDDDTTDDARLRTIVERRFSFVRMGFSYRVTELEAALGVGQLEQKDAMLAWRRDNAARLSKGLERFAAHVQLPVVPPDREHAFMIYPIMTRDGCDRDALVGHLEQRGVETRYLFPLLTQPVYRKLFGDTVDRFPVARAVHERAFYIGCHQGLTAEDIDYVVEAFDAFFRARS